MAASFQVDTDQIHAAAGDITRISHEIEAQVSAMMSRLGALEGAWSGVAAGQFQAVAAEWQGTAHQVRESLERIGRVLGAAGVRYAETEAEALRMFS